MSNKLINTLLFFLLFYPSLALAGPGGKIAKAVVTTFWGRVILAVLVIFFLPLICFTLLKEYLAQKRAHKDLKIAAELHPDFEWIKLRKRIQDCFFRVHSAWEKSDVSAASDWMTSWYWQNQQLVYLDRWERDGLKNICEVDKINTIKPIFFSLGRDKENLGEGSELAVLIDAKMRDYLEKKISGELVEGSREKQDVERVWSFTYESGKWVVSNIDEGSNSLEYVDMMKDVPNIEETLKHVGQERV